MRLSLGCHGNLNVDIATMATKRKAAAVGLLFAGIALKRRQAKVLNRLIWSRNWIQRRERLGAYQTLLQELRDEDLKVLKNVLRMDEATFHDILIKVIPLTQKPP